MSLLLWLSNAFASAVVGGTDELSVLAQVGAPWKQVRIHAPVNDIFNIVGEYQLAKTTRHQFFVGVNQLYVDRKWRLTGDIFGGVIKKNGELSQQGAAGELRLRAGKTTGRANPWFTLGTHHLLLRDQIVIERESGVQTTVTPKHVWSLTGAVGFEISFKDNLSLVAGLDLPWIPVPAPSIPGAHLGLTWSAK